MSNRPTRPAAGPDPGGQYLRTPASETDAQAHVVRNSRNMVRERRAAADASNSILNERKADQQVGARIRSDAPSTPKTLARLARRAREDVQTLSGDAQMTLLRQLEASGQLRTFVDHGSEFRDKLMSEMPGMAQRLVDFLSAKPVYVTNQRGDQVLQIPEDAALTKEQLAVLKSVLDKFVPQQKPMDLDGKQQAPPAPRKVSIHVHTVGNTPDYRTLPGGTDGITGSGAAKPVTTIVFDKPKDGGE